jgi:hypothetical protein
MPTPLRMPANAAGIGPDLAAAAAGTLAKARVVTASVSPRSLICRPAAEARLDFSAVRSAGAS